MPGIPWSTFNDGFTPAPSWRFNVDLPSPAQIGTAMLASSPDNFSGDGPRPLTIPGAGSRWGSSNLGLLVSSFQLIHKSIETDQVVFAAHPRFFPSIVTYDMLNVTFIETERYDVARFYTQWRNKVIDKDGNFGLPRDYWQRIVITPLTLQGRNSITYEYEDCFPVRCDGANMDGSSTNHVTCTISFVVNTITDPR